MKSRIFAALAGLALLSACTVPPLDFQPARVSPTKSQVDAALVGITVAVAPKDERTGKIEIAGAESGIAQLWKSALEDSITRMAAFRDDAPTRVNLSVTILKLDVAGPGFTMISRTEALYELIDRKTGAIIMKTKVISEGRSPPGENFMGAVRMRISASNSVQNNIQEFLRRLAISIPDAKPLS